jgi:transient-receptor-potential-like protein
MYSFFREVLYILHQNESRNLQVARSIKGYLYFTGFIWEETMEIFQEGIQSYLRNMWNFIDFTRNSLYVSVAILRIAAYIQQSQEISADPSTAYIPREQWDDFDPQLIAEGLFAAANIFR